ncbi:ion transporter [Ramlibacter alkalitolerans]|uniref:Ion transporter n=1 Tax=Ramlibacter alkalitolerans TaxID=2039631 RepID=A0ABS1JJ75_9BURK|nr:ion transporter [Ramlibacter alkalitolerans]MBL0424278.1 ion transporter [Ramlibacter alkalitolerans]
MKLVVIDAEAELGKPPRGWRRRLFEIVFESETPEGRLFDKCIILAIIVSVVVVIVDSVPSSRLRLPTAFNIAEWCFTALFTVEYLARIVSVQRPWRYVRSFFGIVDLLSVLPTYLAVLLPETHALIDVRILRLLRVFRIFKLTDYMVEYQMLADALAASRRKILVFLSAVLMVVLVLGTLLYVVEGPRHGFKDIPTSVYWAVTTITTVGFGDVTPKTEVGRFIASVMMLIGWGTLAVPTGIVTAEMTARRMPSGLGERTCANCGVGGHAGDARYCRLCAAPLVTPGEPKRVDAPAMPR